MRGSRLAPSGGSTLTDPDRHVTFASPHAIRRRLSASLALLAALGLGACKGNADGRTAAAAGVAGAQAPAGQDAAAPVVIAVPAGRYTAGATGATGTIAGVASSTSPLAPLPALPVGADSAVCGSSIADSSALQAGTGLGNVVVWLEGVRKGKPVTLDKRIEIESDHCRLVPRVQGAYTGGAVNVVGHETFRQHLRFVAGGEKEPRATILLGKDEQVIPTELPLKSPGLVVVRDQDHAWPRAFVAVFDHPYFAVTKPDGSFVIDQVPVGAYTLVSWHERAGRTEQKVTVAAGGAAKVEVKLSGK